MGGKQTVDQALDAAMRDDALVPSSGFAAAVMTAIHDEAATPAPIAFPWSRVWPAAALAVVFTAAPLAVGIGRATPNAGAPAGELAQAVETLTWLAANPDLQLAALAIGLSGLLVALPARLVSPR